MGAWMQQPSRLSGWVYLVLAAFSIFLLFTLLHGTANSSSGRPSYLGYPKARSPTQWHEDDVTNSTLGFQKIFAVSLPERSDHRDALALASSLTGFHIDWVDGVRGDSIPDKAYPPGGYEAKKEKQKNGIGAWRAHMNALRHIVENDISSALVFEDDIDWDVRIKSQLQSFAKMSRTLLQPLASRPSAYFDPTYPFKEAQLGGAVPVEVKIETAPPTTTPTSSPYGDDWDVMWLGHCGAAFSKPAGNSSLGRVTMSDDVTVAEKQHLTTFMEGMDKEKQGGFDGYKSYPDHTRLVFHPRANACTFGYAVSKRGAQRLLYQMGVKLLNGPFDIMLANYCEGSHGYGPHNCVGVSPGLFDTHFAAGNIAKDSDISDNGRSGVRQRGQTLNIRWSARLNYEKLLAGRTDFDDQYPDERQ